MSIRFHRPLGWEYWRVWFVDRFGWSLEYVDALDFQEAQVLIDVVQNGDLAHAQNQAKAMRHKSRGR